MSLYKKNYRIKTIVEVNKSMKRQDYDVMLKNGKRKIVEIGILCFISFCRMGSSVWLSRAEHSNLVVAEHSMQQILKD